MLCINELISQATEWAEDLDTEELQVFTTAKRHPPFHHWEPIHITTHDEPLFDERLTYEGKHDKHTQVGIMKKYPNYLILVLNFVSMLKMYELCLMDYDFMILNSPFLVHHPGIKSRKMGNKSENKSMVDAQNLFIYKQVMPELNFLHGKRKECHL